MNRPTEQHLLAFLEGELDEGERIRLLDNLERDPELARRLQAAARGLAAVRSLEASALLDSSSAQQARKVKISPWWAAVAAALALVVAVPATLWLNSSSVSDGGDLAAPLTTGLGEPTSGFVLVLHGTWPDAGTVDAAETQRRATEYWGWAESLADDAVLLAAGDLRFEPGQRLGPGGAPVRLTGAVVDSPDFVVGMLALRVNSYEAALALARECPHLRYGGSVSIRQMGRGFATVEVGRQDGD